MNYNNLFPVVAYPIFQEGGVTTPVPVPAPAPATVPVEPDEIKPVYDNPVYGDVMTWLNENPIYVAPDKVLSIDEYEEIKVPNAYPKVSGKLLYIPRAGYFNEEQYKIVKEFPVEGKDPIRIYEVVGGEGKKKYVVDDKEFNKQFFTLYQEPKGRSRELYPVYGRGIPYRTKREGGSIEGGLKIGKSRIEGAGKGLFSNRQFKKNELIGLAHRNNQPASDVGKMHNHSDNPNMYSIKQGNERYVYAKRDIGPDEELTTDYRMQPELEQPEDFKKGGSIPRLPNKSKKGVNSKAYSRSLEATNRLFAKNPLFEVPKSRKRKIYDPNAKYYQSGGSISFDFDDTLNTDLGLQMAQNTPITDRYIISARPEVTPDMLQRAYEAGVPQDRIFAMGSDEAKIAKVRELGIDRHVDNKQSVVDSLGPTGQLFQDGGFIETELTEKEIQAYRDGGYIVEELD